MTQIKTAKDFHQEMLDTKGTIWMEAAAITIAEAHLQDRFNHHLKQVAKKHDAKELFETLSFPAKGEK